MGEILAMTAEPPTNPTMMKTKKYIKCKYIIEYIVDFTLVQNE